MEQDVTLGIGRSWGNDSKTEFRFKSALAMACPSTGAAMMASVSLLGENDALIHYGKENKNERQCVPLSSFFYVFQTTVAPREQGERGEQRGKESAIETRDLLSLFFFRSTWIFTVDSSEESSTPSNFSVLDDLSIPVTTDTDRRSNIINTIV